MLLELPEAGAATIEQPKKRERNASALRGTRLLVAEDNPINQQLALEFLQRAGATVIIAENGREAVAAATGAAAAGNAHDAILMDIHMPVLDGLEAVRILRESGTRTPIIAVSADALGSHRAAALEAGCDAYVTKPIDFDVLLAELTRLLPQRPVELRRRATDHPPEPSGAPTTEAPAAAPAEPSLQRLPGIDIGAAIRGHNGNIKLMLKLMGDFGRYYGDAGPRIRRMVTQGEFEDAERLAHNLHGVAGSFGAQRLQGASKALEIALAGDRDEAAGNILGLVQRFETALQEVLEAADALASERVALRASDFEDR